MRIELTCLILIGLIVIILGCSKEAEFVKNMQIRTRLIIPLNHDLRTSVIHGTAV